MANWMLLPPVSTPISRMMAQRGVAHPLVFLVGQRLGRGDGDESPVWTPIGSKFSIEQTMTTLSARSRITSSSYSFQPMTDSSISTSPTGLRSRPRAIELVELLAVVGDAAAGAAQREAGPQHARQPAIR